MARIGIEWEFWCDSNTLYEYDLAAKYSLSSEYYTNMWEFNNFLKNINTKEDLENALNEIKSIMYNIKDDFIEYEDWCNIHTQPYQVDDLSLVFNGLHIHISLDSVEETKKRFLELKHSNYVEWFKTTQLPSPRSLFSHHIWGGERIYSHNYKRKAKFKPFIYHPYLNTIEIRICDIEDILYTKRKGKLIDFLWDIIIGNLPKTPKKYPQIVYGDKINEMIDLVKECFTKKSIFKIEERSSGIIIHSPKVNYYFNKDYNEISYQIN